MTVICRSHGGLSATEKGEKFALNDKGIYFNVLPNGVSCIFYYTIAHSVYFLQVPLCSVIRFNIEYTLHVISQPVPEVRI